MLLAHVVPSPLGCTRSTWLYGTRLRMLGCWWKIFAYALCIFLFCPSMKELYFFIAVTYVQLLLGQSCWWDSMSVASLKWLGDILSWFCSFKVSTTNFSGIPVPQVQGCIVDLSVGAEHHVVISFRQFHLFLVFYSDPHVLQRERNMDEEWDLVNLRTIIENAIRLYRGLVKWWA